MYKPKSCLPVLPAIILFALSIARAQVNVVTVNYDDERSNSNVHETILNTSNVNTTQFGKLFSLPVDGQVYAQPLYVSGVDIPGLGKRNVVYAVTMHNGVYAFDADAKAPEAPLWHVNLGPSVSTDFLGFTDVVPEVGILGTPCIDLASNTMYFVANTFENGTSVYRLHAFDLANAQEKFGGPTVIQAGAAGLGALSQNGIVSFDPTLQLQRPGLFLLNGAVYLAFGSHADQGFARGWLLAYDAQNIQKQLAVFDTTPNGALGSIWQAGHGLPIEEVKGNIYALTGNGNFDGVANFGQAMIRLSTSNGLSVADYFAPEDFQKESDDDNDLGSVGPILINNTDLVLGGGKSGYIFVMKRNQLGHVVAGNTQVVQSFPATGYGIFSIALWNSHLGPMLYVWGWGDNLKAFRMTNGLFNTAPVSQSSVSVGVPYEGMAVSADGTAIGTGIVWAVTQNVDGPSVPGTLRAFDAADVTRQLWNSATQAPQDSLGNFAKFATPLIASGRVYVPTFSNRVVVYGPRSAAPDGQAKLDSVSSAASYTGQGLAPGELVAIMGSNIGPAGAAGLKLDASGLVGTELANIRVLFDGVPGPLVYVSSGQINAIVPFSVLGNSSYTQVQVEYQGKVSASRYFAIVDSAPGLFTADASGSGQGAILNHDLSANSTHNPAQRGSIVVLYGTGGGQTNPPSSDGALTTDASLALSGVSVTIGGKNAIVTYAGGAPGLVAGVMQVNAQLPPDVAAGDAVPVVLKVGGASSQPGVTLAVK